MFEQKKDPGALLQIVPPVFFPYEFKPLAYGSVWFFDPLKVAAEMERHEDYRRFCENPPPEGNYFSRTVILLKLVGALVLAKNRRHGLRWKSTGVCYRAVGSANRGAWGIFVRLKGLSPQKNSKVCEPSMISLILPQRMTGIVCNGAKLIHEELFHK